MDSLHDRAVVSEDELRRYLRHASTLLALATPTDRLVTLRRARHWIAGVLAGVDQLLRESQTADTLDEPLTSSTDPVTIEAPQ